MKEDLLNHAFKILSQNGWGNVNEENFIFKLQDIISKYIKMDKQISEIHKILQN